MTWGVRVIQKQQHPTPWPLPLQCPQSKAQVWCHLPMVLTLILGSKAPDTPRHFLLASSSRQYLRLASLAQP